MHSLQQACFTRTIFANENVATNTERNIDFSEVADRLDL